MATSNLKAGENKAEANVAAPAAVVESAVAPAADPTVAELKSLVALQAQAAAQQSANIDKLVGVLTAQAAAAATAPAAPVAAPVAQVAPVVNFNVPDQADKHEKDKAKIAAAETARQQQLQAKRAKLRAGEKHFEVCTMRGEGAQRVRSGRPEIVGASSPSEAKHKYEEYMGVQGCSFPSAVDVVEVKHGEPGGIIPKGMFDRLKFKSPEFAAGLTSIEG